jgi:drug/metabolite transporter (DMT)-like permease
MQAEIISLLAAIGWGANAILVRKGSRTGDIFGAAFMSFVVTAIFLWFPIVLSQSLHLIRSRASIYFILSGLMQPLLARIFSYIGIVRMGVSRSSPLRNTDPVYSVIIATVFLQERPGSLVYLGTFFIMAGAWLVVSGRKEEGGFRLLNALFPLGAGFFGAVSQNLRKFGLLILPDPFIAAAVTTTTSLVILSTYLLISGKTGSCRPDRASLPFFGAAAFVSMGAQFCNFLSLKLGDVSIVVPLMGTSPLFAIFFSALFLRQLETVTPRVVTGALLMVAGVISITGR